MKISRNKAALWVLTAALVGSAGLSVAQSGPESLLPPGFDDPVAPAPAPSPRPGATPAPSAPPQPGVPAPAPGVPGAVASPGATPTPGETPVIDLAKYELPSSAQRPLSEAGAIGPEGGGVRPDAFGETNGQGLQRLMRRLDAPIPSRWLSIALRRALVSRVNAPNDVNGADFAAERAWLLLRMGEADAARAVVQSVDVGNYTPKLFQVAMQAMLANGDPGGLCPLVEPASKVSNELAWRFARPICTALAAKPTEAKSEFAQARRVTGRTIDSLLAEKVVGAAGQGGAVTIEESEWKGVDRLTAWRFGMATATGVAIPNSLMQTTPLHVWSWRATAPMTSLADRAASAEVAASLGVLSNLALVDLYGEIEGGDEAGTAPAALARDLRNAYSEGSEDDRLTVLKRLWDEPDSRRARYARLVLTARAAARIAPNADRAEDSNRLIAAMLTAGLDRRALLWRSIAPAGSDGWAMLALADPRGRVASVGEVDGYAGSDTSQGQLKARMLLAGLAGLGRLSQGDAQSLGAALNVRFGEQNSWTRAIAAAAERRDAGTVLVLMAIGMQTADWRGVPPETLFHGCAALRAVGMEGEARMIAAEAIARI